MNAAFKSMSDLVADTEDLIAKVVHSQTPEVRALADAVQLSVNRVRGQLRERARALRPSQGTGRFRHENPWVYIAAGLSVAVVIARWRRRRPSRP
jgi:ElaB/YqjD/DUF883 family membrane-anchored ribosome-binding protein